VPERVLPELKNRYGQGARDNDERNAAGQSENNGDVNIRRSMPIMATASILRSKSPRIARATLSPPSFDGIDRRLF